MPKTLRKMPPRLIAQMMRLVKNINAIRHRRQNNPTAKRQIRQHQIMIGHQNLRLIQSPPRPEKRTPLDMRTSRGGALIPVASQRSPIDLRNSRIPTIAVAVPIARTKRRRHLLI